MKPPENAPRNVAGPIAQGADFWGRKEDVASLWRMLERGSVLLSAPRRHGKSSLMAALEREPRSGWTVVQMDVEYLESPEEFLTELTAALLHLAPIRRLFKKAKQATGALFGWIASGIESIEAGAGGIGELKLTLRNALSDPAVWPQLAEQLLDQLEEHEGDLLINIDEFPMMLGNFLDRDEAIGLRFLRWFRTVRQQRATTKVRFLLGGSVNIEPRLESLGCEALINDLQRFHLEPLLEPHRAEFVSAVLAGEGAAYEAGVPAEIVRVADTGVPFFLQVLIEECRLVARRENRAIMLADVYPAYDQRVLGPPGRARFSHYQSRLREHYGPLEHGARVVLGALARNHRTSLESLRAIASQAANESEFERLLMLLQSDHYIFCDATHVWFTSGFLRDWWFRNVPTPRGTS